MLDDLRISLSHLLANLGDKFVEEWLVQPDRLAQTHGTAQNATQHIAAAFVAWQHAVSDQEGAGARVVCNDAESKTALVLVVFLAGKLFHILKQRHKEVRVEVRVHTLHDRGDTLKPHAGINVWLWQRREVAFLVAVVLHEHEVPDLQPAVAVANAERTAVFTVAGVFFAAVVVHLAARAAWADIAHLPEVVLLAQAQDAVFIVARHLVPDLVGFVVVLVDRDPELFLRQLQLIGEKIPAIFDRLFLEIIAEGEIPQHFKESMMARRFADGFQVVVLAAGAHTFLHRRRTMVVAAFQPQENILELVHPSVRKKKRRVIIWH